MFAIWEFAGVRQADFMDFINIKTLIIHFKALNSKIINFLVCPVNLRQMEKNMVRTGTR